MPEDNPYRNVCTSLKTRICFKLICTILSQDLCHTTHLGKNLLSFPVHLAYTSLIQYKQLWTCTWNFDGSWIKWLIRGFYWSYYLEILGLSHWNLWNQAHANITGVDFCLKQIEASNIWIGRNCVFSLGNLAHCRRGDKCLEAGTKQQFGHCSSGVICWSEQN